MRNHLIHFYEVDRAALIAGNARSHKVLCKPHERGSARNLWERALPAMRPVQAQPAAVSVTQ